MNPGSHAPQACILIQSSAEIPKIGGLTAKLDDDPALQEYRERIIKTLTDMLNNGKKKTTRQSAFYSIRYLNRKADLMNPDAVKAYIGSLTLSEPTKQKLANNYHYFVASNGLTWEKPFYKYDSKVPITPTKEQAEAIISSSPTLNAATVFRILLESGFEGEELHGTTERDIDTEQGIITVAGHKQHNGRSFKLKPSTAEMLRIYMATHHREHPFAAPHVLGQTWRLARERAAKKLSRPDLNKIPLKGLRNLIGILLFQKCKDPWTVMIHMGHKKLDTTQHYLRAMTQMGFQEPEWISKAVKMGEPNSVQQVLDLLDAGFKVETEMDGYKLLRKPK